MVDQIGYRRAIRLDPLRWECSPDGLVGDDGGLELKCSEDRAHI